MVLNDTRRHVEARRAPELLLLLFERRLGHALAAHASPDVRLAVMIRRTATPRVALYAVFQGRDVVDPVRRDVEDFPFPEYGVDRTSTFGRERLSS